GPFRGVDAQQVEEAGFQGTARPGMGALVVDAKILGQRWTQTARSRRLKSATAASPAMAAIVTMTAAPVASNAWPGTRPMSWNGDSASSQRGTSRRDPKSSHTNATPTRP